jgi:hypothetical protein
LWILSTKLRPIDGALLLQIGHRSLEILLLKLVVRSNLKSLVKPAVGLCKIRLSVLTCYSRGEFFDELFESLPLFAGNVSFVRRKFDNLGMTLRVDYIAAGHLCLVTSAYLLDRNLDV